MAQARQELLERVLSAQGNTYSGYATALREIRAGHKKTCWIWWIWPTLKGVRVTSRPEFYVPDAEAALEWLRHRDLGPRFVEITREAVSRLDAGVSPLELFDGQRDMDKFHETVTLFWEVTRGSHPDPMRNEVQSLCHRALKALQLPPHQVTLEVLCRTGELHPQLDPPLFNRTMSNSQYASTPPRTELADFLAELGLDAHTSVMQAEGFDSIAALGTMDSRDAAEMRSALVERGVPGGDVDRILREAAARVRDSTLYAESAPRMRQSSGSGAATRSLVQPQPSPVSQAASVAPVARPAGESRLFSQQPHLPRGAGGVPQALEAAAAAGDKTAAAARTQSLPWGDLTEPQGGGRGGWGACAGGAGAPGWDLTEPSPPLASSAVARFATTTVQKGDSDADVAQQALICLQRMNAATLADPSTVEALQSLRGEASRGWSCMRMASMAPPNTAPYAPNTAPNVPNTAPHVPFAPRLLALDVEMIERRADGVRLPVSAALISYDLSPPRQTKRELFSALVDPSDFDREWLSGPAAYDYKEAFVGLDYKKLLAAHRRGEMSPVRDLQDLVQEHMHSATYLVGHALSNDLKVLRLHGPGLETRVVDTQALYPLPAGGHAKLKTLVEALLPAKEWQDFQAPGASHPPDQVR